jgi:hypothetical protein
MWRRTSQDVLVLADRCGVAYDLLPCIAVDLHRRIAESLDAPPTPAPAICALLARHWDRAEVTDKAILYLEQAGEQALLRDACTKPRSS